MAQMMESRIRAIVESTLAGASEQYLREIVDHGIHNVTSDFDVEGSETGEYEAFEREFDRQARRALIALEAAGREREQI